MLAVCFHRFPSIAAVATATDAVTPADEQAGELRKTFSYSRASPSIRWPELKLKDPVQDWITLSKELDAQKAHDAHHATHHSHNDAQREDTRSPPRKLIGYSPPINPYIAAHGKSHPALAAQSSFVASLIEPEAQPRRKTGKLIRLSRLALIKAKDWRERVQRLSEAILKLDAGDSVADLLKVWEEQLAATDMCIVLKRVGDINWRRALELYEWYNVKHWYEPYSRMLASILSILGRVHQVTVAKEIFDRAEPSVGNCVQVYNAMMGVYARQGDCDKVQILLNLMKERGCCLDLITYNTVINARCKAGLMPGMAMQLLEDMKRDRLIPDVITYNTLISACASRNDHVEAELVFEVMQSSKCEPDLWTYNALISLYGRTLGKEGKAIDYFNILQRQGLVPDAVTFNAVLYAFAKTGRVNDFDEVRRQMRDVGCSADEVTYNIMISMYGRLSLHKEALLAYHEMKDEGCRPDAVTFTVLIDVMGKAGMVKEAEQVFQEMSDLQVFPTLQTFSAMMHAYAKAGKYTEAQSTYDCMLQTGIVPDRRAFCLMLDVLQKINLPQKAMIVYQKSKRRGFVPDSKIYGTLLQWLSQEGTVKDVDMISNDLLNAGFSHIEVCTTLLEAHLPIKASELLLSVLAQGSHVDEQLLLDVLQMFGDLEIYHEAQLFVDSLSGFSSKLGSQMHEALLTILAKAKKADAVKIELDKARVNGKSLSLDAYRTLITLFQDAEMPDQILLISSDMQLFGVEMDEICKKFVSGAYDKLESGQMSPNRSRKNTELPLEAYISVIEEYGKQRLWERAEGTFREMQAEGYRPSLKAWNTLISAYAFCGEYDNARFALAEMIADGKTPTERTCTALLQAVVNAERTKEICNVLQEMHQYGVCPSKNVFMDIIESFVNGGKGHAAKAVFYQLKRAGYFPNMQVYKSLILSFTKSKHPNDAEDMIKEMEADGFSPDVIIYNSMITLYGKLGYFSKGAQMFMRMQAAGCSPDSYTYNSLIWIFSKRLKIQEALAIVRQMEKAGFAPDAESYTALISACGRLGMMDAAEVLFKDAHESGCQLNSKVFHAMMNVYRNAGQPDQVEKLLQKMKAAGIVPTLGTMHVLLDSYGKGGAPDQAEAVFDNIVETGLSPGTVQYVGVINAYLKNKDYDQAIEKLLGMKIKGHEPDFMIWTTVVAAASRCKESSMVIKLLGALGDVGFSLPLRLLTEKINGLIEEFDKTLQALESSGEGAGLGLTNVILDLLWAFQMHGTSGKLFIVAIKRNIYSSSLARVLVKDWSADLRRLSPGAALIALTLWLDQMQDAALQGFPEPPKTVVLTTGGKGSTTHNETSIEQTIKVHLWTIGSPFLKSETPGIFKSKGYSLCHWLKDSPHCMDLKLRNFAVLPEFNTMEVHNGAFMPVRLVAGLQQIEQSVGELRPKKFRKLIHLTQMQRADVIAAELKAKEEMIRKGLLDSKGRRKAWMRKRLRKMRRQPHT
ncbi:hypothetical protein GOP47_0029358 [Adiantum capillus-veneris]|nr:hypothetical protein GOP47_0029358 [Adiantum capillus-veneris]